MNFNVTATQDSSLGSHYADKVRLSLYLNGVATISKDVRGPANVRAFIAKAVHDYKVPEAELEQVTREALKGDAFGHDIEALL